MGCSNSRQQQKPNRTLRSGSFLFANHQHHNNQPNIRSTVESDSTTASLYRNRIASRRRILNLDDLPNAVTSSMRDIIICDNVYVIRRTPRTVVSGIDAGRTVSSVVTRSSSDRRRDTFNIQSPMMFRRRSGTTVGHHHHRYHHPYQQQQQQQQRRRLQDEEVEPHYDLPDN